MRRSGREITDLKQIAYILSLRHVIHIDMYNGEYSNENAHWAHRY